MGRAKTTLVTFLPPPARRAHQAGRLPRRHRMGGPRRNHLVGHRPGLMLRASRKKFPAAAYSAPGGSLTIYVLLVYGCITAVCHILFVLHYLPMYE